MNKWNEVRKRWMKANPKYWSRQWEQLTFDEQYRWENLYG